MKKQFFFIRNFVSTLYSGRKAFGIATVTLQAPVVTEVDLLSKEIKTIACFNTKTDQWEAQLPVRQGENNQLSITIDDHAPLSLVPLFGPQVKQLETQLTTQPHRIVRKYTFSINAD